MKPTTGAAAGNVKSIGKSKPERVRLVVAGGPTDGINFIFIAHLSGGSSACTYYIFFAFSGGGGGG